MTDEKFVSLLEKIDERISFLKAVKPDSNHHKQLLFSAYDELGDFRSVVVDYLKAKREADSKIVLDINKLIVYMPFKEREQVISKIIELRDNDKRFFGGEKMNLDFSKCETKEDVERVFKKFKKRFLGGTK